MSEGRANGPMLVELRVENFAVIERAEARFGAGLNLLTGETGAGKSILIDALALLLGGKATAECVRHGAEKAVVGCVFEATRGALAVLEENGIDAGEEEGFQEHAAGASGALGSGGVIVLRREITAAGKGRVWVNNQAATVGVLRELAPELGLIHAQGETLGSFDGAQQRGLVDRFGGISTEEVRAAFGVWRGVKARLAELEASEGDRLRMADLWRFQAGEIGGAEIESAEEDSVLEAEKRVLGNAERLQGAARRVDELLYEGEGAAEGSLGAALKLVEELGRFDERFRVAAEELAGAKAVVEEVSGLARGFAQEVEAGPERLAEIEERLAVLDRLKRKYGGTLAEVMRFGEESARRLGEVENRDALVAELRREEALAAGVYEAAAGRVTAGRLEAAGRLAGAAEKGINELAMRVRFGVEVRAGGSWSAEGVDAVEFRIATNAGEPLKGLEEIASGGEMSRVMLALKCVVEEAATRRGGRRRSALPRTLVFDEIDIGIGGRAAEAVGAKLKALSRTQQVICITHLPQIAAFGDQHFAIEKREAKGRTQTAVRAMGGEERVREIARMLSGAVVTETSLRHAESLIRESAG